MRGARSAAHAASAPAVPEPLAGEELAIARSVLYASLFDYPLTLAQLRQTLLESVQTPSEILATYARSHALQAAVECRDGFFFPRGQHELVEERRRRETRSRAFLRTHRVMLTLICALPYVRLVALSGSIAHFNLDGDGDLDLFIATRGRRVWSTTVAIILLAKLLRRRRIVCANFVVADSTLKLEPEDLFTASQIIHLRPLVGHDVFRLFVAANPFVNRFYPNFHPVDRGGFPFRTNRILGMVKSVLETVLAVPSLMVEAVCRRAYGRYLRGRAASWRSPDQVRLQRDCLKLHTHSHRASVLERFEAASQELRS